MLRDPRDVLGERDREGEHGAVEVVAVAGRVREHLAHRHRALEPRELGQVVRHGRIERDRAAIDELQDAHAREQLRCRCERNAHVVVVGGRAAARVQVLLEQQAARRSDRDAGVVHARALHELPHPRGDGREIAFDRPRRRRRGERGEQAQARVRERAHGRSFLESLAAPTCPNGWR
ncbi:MAG TPA: hypothetical protein VI238_15555 [Dokdonella sp.]